MTNTGSSVMIARIQEQRNRRRQINTVFERQS